MSRVEEFLSGLSNRMGTSADAIKISEAAVLIVELEEVVDFDNIVAPILEAGEVLTGQTRTEVPVLMRLTAKEEAVIAENLDALQDRIDDLRGRYGGGSAFLNVLDQ